jgi:serine/threonine-protein kinase RsbW
MEQLYQLSQTTSLDEVATLRQRVQQLLISAGGDPEAVGDLILALNEALVNSLHHGYAGQPGWLQIEIGRAGRSLVIQQYDTAPPFDPTAVPPPDTTLPLAVRPLGGMGVQMMRNFTDELHYQRTADGCNRLTFIKHNLFA